MSSLPGEPPEAAPTPVSGPTTTDTAATTQPGDRAPVVSTTDGTPANEKAQIAGTDGNGAPVFEMGGGSASGTVKKKRKGRKKPIHERGETALNRYRGTGFEEYFADPPLTANEHWDEQNNIYTSERSFEDRIENCIQRFRARRRMDSERNNYFTKYLMLGGIDSAQRQFTGNEDFFERKKKKKDDSDEGEERDVIHKDGNRLSQDQQNRMRKGDRLRADANDVISYNPDVSKYYSPGAKGWVKGDFEGVVAGYLCSKFLEDFDTGDGSLEVAIDTIVSFLRYVLQHDVCPEYEESVNKALAVCEKAKTELPLCANVYSKSPGDFNLAARILYCTDGKCDDCTVDPAEPTVVYREQARQHWEFEDSIIVARSFDAKRVFMATIALQGHDSLAVPFQNNTSVTVAATYIQDYEVVHPEATPEFEHNPIRLDAGTKDKYARIKDKDGKLGTIKPAGVVALEPCVIEDGWDNRPSQAALTGKVQYFFLDDNILELLKVGMKLRLVVSELNIGVKFIKKVLDVLPSFYTFLHQELMLDYKDPKPSERPPPSVDDPDADYRAMEEMALKDVGE